MRRKLSSLAILIAMQLALADSEASAGYETGRAALDTGAYGEAISSWEPVAEEGDSRAQYGLGVIFEQGRGEVGRNLDAAIQWYALAARQGHPAALNNLGLMYAQGRGVERDVSRAIRLWLESAQAGHLMAMYNLALAYYRGEGLEAPDAEEALHWFRQAAEAGLPDGQYALGQLYNLGVMVAQDEATALAWYDAAASQGHESAAARAETLRSDGVQPGTVATGSMEPSRAHAESAPEAVPEPQPSSPSAPATAALADAPSVKPARAPVPTRPPEEEIRLWLGSLDSEAKAERHWEDMRQRFAEILADVDMRTVSVVVPGSGTFYRVLAGPFAEAAEARAACIALRAASEDAFCQVMAP